MRLDLYIVRRGYAGSREKAAFLIKNGGVSINGKLTLKPSADVTDTDAVLVDVSEGIKYVGRGGYKLQKAISVFGLNLSGRVCVDIGASTGGFTDCALQNGAVRVYAIDVGTGQLDPRLRADPRVTDMQGVDIRAARIPDSAADFVMSDVSFISLVHVLPHIKRFMRPDADAVCLVKPQFEIGPTHMKNGVVRDPETQLRALRSVADSAYAQGLYLYGLDFSPIRGGSGNIEFIAHFRSDKPSDREIDFKQVVLTAHKILKKGGDCFESRNGFE